MNYTILSVIYFIPFLVSIIINYMISKKQYSPAFIGISLSYGIYFFLIPSITFFYYEGFALRYSLFSFFVVGKSITEYLITLFSIVISYIIILIIYLTTCKKYISVKKRALNITINESKIEKSIKYIGYFTLIVGGVSFFIFIQSLGGVFRAFELAEYNRSHTAKLTEQISYGISLFSVIAKIITISPYMFLLLCLFEKRNKINWFFLILAILINITYLIYNAGKAPILIFLVSFMYIILSKYKIKYIWSKIIVLGVVCMPLIGILEDFFKGLNQGEFQKIQLDYYQYIYEFSHPYRNVLNMTNIVESKGYSYGVDYINAFLNLIPGINKAASYEKTSLFFRGTDWGNLGGIPNDFITFNYLQIGMLGVVLASLLLGFIVSRVDYFISKISNINIRSVFIALSATLMFSYVPNADLGPILKQNINLIVLLYLGVFSYKKLTLNKNNNIGIKISP